MAGSITGYSNQENAAFDRGYNDGYRTALESIRALHFGCKGVFGGMLCDDCRQSWPCATAKLIYADEELATQDRET